MIVLLGALAALVLGIVTGDALGPGRAHVPLALVAVALVGAAAQRQRRVVVAVAVLAGSLVVGVTVEQRALEGLVHSPLAGRIERRAEVDAVATLTEDPSGLRFRAEALARVDRVDGRVAGGRTVLLGATGDERSALVVLEAGDHVRVRGRLGPLSGYATRLRWRHAVGELGVERVEAVAGATEPLAVVANAARHLVLQGSANLPATARALLAGFVLGDTRAIPADVVVAFRDAGLSHLLAVSGANVAFALAVVDPVLRRLRLGARLTGGLVVLVVFGTMTRWEPSVLRASVMAGLVMLARFLGRPAAAGRVLALATMALLVADPFLLHSVGFLLSCGACAGIAVLAGPLTARLRGPAWLREGLGVTAAAEVGVAPVLLTTFGSVPVIALPANLVAAPFVGPLTIWGLVASAVGGVLGSAVAAAAQLPTLAMLGLIEGVARIAATVPLAVGPVPAAIAAGTGGLAWGVRRWWTRPLGRVARRGRCVRGAGSRSDPP